MNLTAHQKRGTVAGLPDGRARLGLGFLVG